MTGQPAMEASPDLEVIRREVERHKDTLVEKAEGLFEERRKRAQGNPAINVVPVDRAQLENVLRLALSTTSVKELVNFIKYQMGREGKVGQDWRNGDFGKDLIYVIERDIAPLASDSEYAIRFVRLFLGYFARAAVYFRAAGGEEGNHPGGRDHGE